MQVLKNPNKNPTCLLNKLLDPTCSTILSNIALRDLGHKI